MRTDSIGKHFKYGLRVVIKSAHERRRDLIAHIHELQAFQKLIHVLFAVIAQKIADHGRILQKLLTALILAIQDPQRVQFIPCFAGLAKRIVICQQILTQSLLVLRSALRAADAVQTNGKTGQADFVQKLDHDGNAFGVGTRTRCAEYLHSELVMLAKPPCLRILIAKYGVREIKHFGRLHFAK